MQISEVTTSTSQPGPEDWFTGQTWMEDLGTLQTPTPTRILRVTFAPGARTAWHTHPLGQVLHILDGVARIGREGEPVSEAHAGDSVVFAPGERHWHGAAPSRLMAHLAVQATDPEVGSETLWEGHVRDESYGDGE
ncbi:MAG: cupin domain-containing protein [Pseudonocardiales bacterium]|nr:MAG: cupin domain-containing protein [Pseudonocardiales bacterium]